MSTASTSIFVPTQQVPITLDAVIDPPIRKLSIEHDGAVRVEYLDDAEHGVTGGRIRNRLQGQDIVGQIVKVYTADTTLTVDQMMGERSTNSLIFAELMAAAVADKVIVSTARKWTVPSVGRLRGNGVNRSTFRPLGTPERAMLETSQFDDGFCSMPQVGDFTLDGNQPYFDFLVQRQNLEQYPRLWDGMWLRANAWHVYPMLIQKIPGYGAIFERQGYVPHADGGVFPTNAAKEATDMEEGFVELLRLSFCYFGGWVKLGTTDQIFDKVVVDAVQQDGWRDEAGGNHYRHLDVYGAMRGVVMGGEEDSGPSEFGYIKSENNWIGVENLVGGTVISNAELFTNIISLKLAAPAIVSHAKIRILAQDHAFFNDEFPKPTGVWVQDVQTTVDADIELADFDTGHEAIGCRLSNHKATLSLRSAGGGAHGRTLIIEQPSYYGNITVTQGGLVNGVEVVGDPSESPVVGTGMQLRIFGDANNNLIFSNMSSPAIASFKANNLVEINGVRQS